MLLFCLFTMGACSNEEVENIPPEKSSVYTVSLGFSGDIDVSQEPLTRATSTNDIYGINVYYDKDKDGDIKDVYAYGLFDNKEDMIISLLSGHKYKFECSLVKDGKKTLYYGQAFGQKYSGFCYPFQTNLTNSTMLKNEFVIGTSERLTGIKSGKAHISSTTSPSTSNATDYASVNRFYGEATDYIPTVGGQVVIALKRVVFGAKFVITGVKEGTLTASCGSFWSKKTTTDDEGNATIYSFSDVYDCWKNESTYSAKLELSFDSDRGSDWDLKNSSTITFKRNVLTTVKINVSPDLSSGVFTFVEEALDEGENYIDMEINSDGVIDTVVKPTE